MQSGMVYNIQRMSTQDGPGLRTTVFLKGCPLRCLWCSNPESQSPRPQLLVFEDLCTGCGRCLEACPHGAVLQQGGRYNRDPGLCRDCGVCSEVCATKARSMSGRIMRVEDVLAVARRDTPFYAESGGGVTFGGGEPTASGEFLIGLLEACRAEALHTCVDTCGFCPPDLFQRVLNLAELILFDCKHMDPGQHKRLTGQDNTIILDNLRESLRRAAGTRGAEVRIRIPLMPGLNDSEANIAALAALLRPFGKNDVDVLPCHAFGRSKYAALLREPPAMSPYSPEGLSEVLRRFAEYGLNPVVVT